VVVGGMGSIVGAFVAAVLVAMVKAVCIAAGDISVFGAPFPLSKLTLVAEFLVMAVVLVWRPWGLFGKPQGLVRGQLGLEQPLRPLPAIWRRAGWVALAALLLVAFLSGPAPYAVVLMIDVLIAVLFAASLHFLMGPSGMHSFGHAAYFGLGAYGAALCVKALGLPMEVSLLLAPLLAAIGAFVFGWWQHDRYNIERINVDAADNILGIGKRNDNLYEVGGGLTWEFAKGWSLNPEILYIRDQSNILAANYSSTEIWITLRKDF
jgi:branched-chain amino acid transport system permease protein